MVHGLRPRVLATGAQFSGKASPRFLEHLRCLFSHLERLGDLPMHPLKLRMGGGLDVLQLRLTGRQLPLYSTRQGYQVS